MEDDLNDEEFIEELSEVEETLGEEVFPLIDALEEEHPNVSAWFAMYINTVHELFYQGWTKEELIAEIEEHHALFLQDEQSVPPGEHLH